MKEILLNLLLLSLCFLLGFAVALGTRCMGADGAAQATLGLMATISACVVWGAST